MSKLNDPRFDRPINQVISEMLNTEVGADEIDMAALFYIEFSRNEAQHLKELAYKMMISIILVATTQARDGKYVELSETCRSVMMSSMITGLSVGYLMGRRGSIGDSSIVQNIDLNELLKGFTISLDPTMPKEEL